MQLAKNEEVKHSERKGQASNNTMTTIDELGTEKWNGETRVMKSDRSEMK